MKGPHGLNDIRFTHHQPMYPFYVLAYPLKIEEGLVFNQVEIIEIDPVRMRTCVEALCLHVEEDDATLDAAKQWLLDLANAKYA